jgi:hypothetical protein
MFSFNLPTTLSWCNHTNVGWLFKISKNVYIHYSFSYYEIIAIIIEFQFGLQFGSYISFFFSLMMIDQTLNFF